MEAKTPLAILGTGNIGGCIARGLVQSGRFDPEKIILTRRKVHLLDEFKRQGFTIEEDNVRAVDKAGTLVVAVEPQQLDPLLKEIGPRLSPAKHTLLSVVSGVSIAQILEQVKKEIPVVRAVPNTAIGIGRSMTCLSSNGTDDKAVATATSIFDTVGKTLVIDEEQMIAATALGACGIAFFLRAIRAASQGGIEVGFHSGDALTIAAQTAKGAAALLLDMQNHPEYEIDKVTTPRGCTIAGLNQMEHGGFSSAMIKGIVTSAEKAAKLYAAGGKKRDGK